MTGTLFLLPNQITEGDPTLTLPAATVDVARTCRRFLAENAKSARHFLKAIGHPTPISDLEIVEIGHEPDQKQFEQWLSPVLAGIDTAIVSESGCPGVADPGASLVDVATQLGIEIKPLVGPCSILLTLMASGMNGQRFRFLGYLPIADDPRADALRSLERASRQNETQLFIETPYRNNKLLAAMTEILALDTRITAATDITGSGEHIRTMSVKAWRDHLDSLPKLPTVFAVLAAQRPSTKGHTVCKPANKPKPTRRSGASRR